MISRKFAHVLFFLISCLCQLAGQNSVSKIADILADGKVEITIAQGFIEEKQRLKTGQLEQIHQHNYNYFLQYFSANQYQFTPGKVRNVVHFHKTTAIKYQTHSGRDTTAQIALEVTLIMPGANSKKYFLEAMQQAEIMIYQGHGRRGLGPDFDDIKVSNENFVMGSNSSLHRAGKLQTPGDRSYREVVIGKNDLEVIPDSAWTRQSRYWLFNVCNSRYYEDELKSTLLPEQVRDRTDILLTSSLISVYATAASSMRYVELLLSGAPHDLIPSKLFEAQQTALFQSGLYNSSVIQSFRPCYYWCHSTAQNSLQKPNIQKKLPPTKRR